MFTGIITDIGTVKAVAPRGDHSVTIATDYDTAGVALGASIACSGVCLTVVAKAPGEFRVDVSAETQRCTAAGMWTPGRRLNLERALKVGDELGGHIVTGHVDAVGRIADITPEGDSHRLTFWMPADIAPYVAAKGSICLDGASLTVNSVADGPDGSHFTVNIIPHTAQWTTFGGAKAGDEVNIEIDVLARYLHRMKMVLG
ncbi:riboflavin synthase [Sandarakinorhabdus sp.]|uniref:riboflavin synthase n=1 Tax=Sandarakinorhabdus sp. TaxID=1916663 RepID=UPI00286DB297|nr:riboflavin synthase [Sandarakinorhabdus sp.]